VTDYGDSALNPRPTRPLRQPPSPPSTRRRQEIEQDAGGGDDGVGEHDAGEEGDEISLPFVGLLAPALGLGQSGEIVAGALLVDLERRAVFSILLREPGLDLLDPGDEGPLVELRDGFDHPEHQRASRRHQQKDRVMLLVGEAETGGAERDAPRLDGQRARVEPLDDLLQLQIFVPEIVRGLFLGHDVPFPGRASGSTIPQMVGCVSIRSNHPPDGRLRQ
jgi:hypothetical protein